MAMEESWGQTRCNVHTNQGLFITFTLTQGPNMIKLQFRAPDSFGSWMFDVVQNIQQLLGCCLEHTGHAMILYQFTHFKGNPASLAICHLIQRTCVRSSHAPRQQYLLKGKLQSLYLSQDISFLLQRASVPHDRDMEEYASGSCRSAQGLSTYSEPTRASSRPPAPCLPFAQVSGLIPSEQPNSQCSELTIRALE